MDVSILALRVLIPFTVGGIVASYAFLAKDAPKYHNGYTILISFLCLSAASIIGYYLVIRAENRRLIRENGVDGTEGHVVLNLI